MRRFLAGAACGAAILLPGTASASDDGLVGQKAPEITVQSWIQGDGRTSLADYRGEVVLLEFWSTH